MAGGLSYASGRDMPPGMQIAAADKIIERFRIASSQMAAAMQEQSQTHPVAAEQEDPCDYCLRWDECSGVDNTCPRR